MTSDSVLRVQEKIQDPGECWTMYWEILDAAGAVAVPAGFSAISYKTFEHRDRGTVVDEGSLTPADVIKVPPVGHPGNPDAGAVWNFVWTVPVTAHPKPNRLYRLEVKFSDVGGGVFYLLYDITTRPVFSAEPEEA